MADVQPNAQSEQKTPVSTKAENKSDKSSKDKHKEDDRDGKDKEEVNDKKDDPVEPKPENKKQSYTFIEDTAFALTIPFADGWNRIASLLVTPDDAVIAVGEGSFFPGGVSAGLGRLVTKFLVPNGQDASFGQNGFAFGWEPNKWNFVARGSLQGDGKIFVTGASVQNPGESIGTIYRFNSDGTFDLSFGQNGLVTIDLAQSDWFVQTAVQQDGKIVATGMSSDASLAKKLFVVRYLSSGTRDLTFGQNGIVYPNFNVNHETPRELLIQPDGKILIQVNAEADDIDMATGAMRPLASDIAVVRLNSDGSFDPSFGNGGKVLISAPNSLIYGYGMLLDQNGDMVIHGLKDGQAPQGILVGLNKDGVIDTKFAAAGMSFKDGRSLMHARFDKEKGVLVISAPSTQGSSGGSYIERYIPGKGWDRDFGDNGRVYVGSNTVDGVALLSNGDIIVNAQASPGLKFFKYNKVPHQ